ncbi:hypothetical protein QFP33_002803 [Pseudomonas aeruginosa]|nr:hypothetical protein [Pseudomonas aeruginosa]ELR9617118.1 hypothetical protein [Pseudomonas aeruginosa]
MSEREHWQRVYESKPSDAVSWFQAEATLSLDLIRRIGAPREAAIIDVGGGASTLVDGPTECSGLPVMRYDADELHAEFGSAFQLTEHRDEHHVTPAGRVQHFVYCHCLKRL